MFLDTIVVGALQANCYALGCEKTRQAIVIDPGDDLSAILNTLRKRDLRLAQIVATHAHFDHVLAARALKEATGAAFYLHPDDRLLLAGMRKTAMAWIGADPGEPPEPVLDLTTGEGIRVGEIELEVRSTPGHSPGGVALVDHERRRVFTGDALFAGSIGRTDLAGGNLEILLKSVREQLLSLPNYYAVLPGHGPASTIGEERRSNPFLMQPSPFEYWR